MEEAPRRTREREWYVPNWGPRRFRLFLGMTFLPYTLMNVSYVVIGAAVAPSFDSYRAGLLALVYLVAVGISAHALDAIGPNKPWGEFLSKDQLLGLALVTLLPALGIGAYLALSYAPLLIVVGAFELFFLLAYNLEPFGGWFHTDLWFSLSWGFLPVVAGYILQTDSLSPVGLAAGVFGFTTAYVEISASRPYKEIRRSANAAASPYGKKFESILKGVVVSVLAVALTMLLLRILT